MKQPKPQNAQAPAKTRQFGKFNRAGAAMQPRPVAEFKRDEQYEASPGVTEALAAVDAGAPALLIVGRAGTGKTRLAPYLKARPRRGVAARGAPPTASAR